MKKLIASIALAGTLVLGAGAATASSGPSLSQFRQLQRQVRSLQADVADLNHDVWDCQILVDPAEQFADGQYYYDLYYDSAC